MPNLFRDLKEQISTLAGSWPSLAALGTFLLYLFGYLSLRFHLTALGIPIDLAVIDERYFYAGAKSLVYILLYIPVIGLVVLVILVVVVPIVLAINALANRYTRTHKQQPDSSSEETPVGEETPVEDKTPVDEKTSIRKIVTESLATVAKRPWIVAFVGIVVSEVWIQFLMRQCFEIHDVLLSPNNIPNNWIGTLMKGEDKKIEVLYFSTIVAGTAVVGGLLVIALRLRKKLATEALLKGSEERDTGTLALLTLLVILFTIQVLLLPVNHGVLIVDKVLPRLKDLGGKEKLSDKQMAWLAWEGTETVTCLVQDQGTWDSGTNRWIRVRTMVILPKKDFKRTEVLANDSIQTLMHENVAMAPSQ